MEERFWAKVSPTGFCWFWTAAKANGYGRFSVGNRLRPAHRVSYELLVGPIPDGLVLDHLCRNRACVNPDHLEPVSEKVNILRGVSSPARNARKSACKRGHRLDDGNTRPIAGPRGQARRQCRQCLRDYARERKRKATALRKAQYEPLL